MESLIRLEVLLAEAGAAIVPAMHPGLEPTDIARRLGTLGLTPTDEVAAWYQWHDGAGKNGDPSELIEIVPGGEFYHLEYLVGECEMKRNNAAYVTSAPDAPFDAESLWGSTWFPLLRLFGKGFLAIDLAGGAGGVSPVHVVWHDSDTEDRARVAWPSIAAFVETVIERFESGEYWVDEAGIVRGDTIDFPTDLA